MTAILRAREADAIMNAVYHGSMSAADAQAALGELLTVDALLRRRGATLVSPSMETGVAYINGMREILSAGAEPVSILAYPAIAGLGDAYTIAARIKPYWPGADGVAHYIVMLLAGGNIVGGVAKRATNVFSAYDTGAQSNISAAPIVAEQVTTLVGRCSKSAIASDINVNGADATRGFYANSSAPTLIRVGTGSASGSFPLDGLIGPIVVSASRKPDAWVDAIQANDGAVFADPVRIFDEFMVAGDLLLPLQTSPVGYLKTRGVGLDFSGDRFITAAGAASLSASGGLEYGKASTWPRIPSSTIKAMTAYVMRQWVDDEALSGTVTIQESDLVYGSVVGLAAGDILTYEELLYGAMLPSANECAQAIGRAVGQRILDEEEGGGSGLTRFLAEMAGQAAVLGWANTAFSTPSGFDSTSQISPQQLAELMLLIAGDETLVGIMGTLTHDLAVTGPSARTIPIAHSIAPYASDFPELIAAKTGTGGSSGQNIIMLWQRPPGTLHATSIMGSTNRFADLRAVMDHV